MKNVICLLLVVCCLVIFCSSTMHATASGEEGDSFFAKIALFLKKIFSPEEVHVTSIPLYGNDPHLTDLCWKTINQTAIKLIDFGSVAGAYKNYITPNSSADIDHWQFYNALEMQKVAFLRKFCTQYSVVLHERKINLNTIIYGKYIKLDNGYLEITIYVYNDKNEKIESLKETITSDRDEVISEVVKQMVTKLLRRLIKITR